MMRKLVTETLLVSFFIILLTVIIFIYDLDVNFEKLFWNNTEGWSYKDYQPWKALYHYGNIPALIVSIGSLILLLMSFYKPHYLKYRKISSYLVLAMIIGPGLLINSLFKEHWGRPRPRSIIEFGGTDHHLQVWEKGISGKGKSFPCGHASVGFYFFTFFFLLRKRFKKTAVLVFVLALFYGGLIGLARMIQGGHFASDVVWSGGLVYLSSFWLFSLMKLDMQLFYQKTESFKPSPWLLAAGLPLLMLGIFLFFLSTPYYRDKTTYSPVNSNTMTDYYFSFETAEVTLVITENDSLVRISELSQGFAFPGSKVKTEKKLTRQADKKDYFRYQQEQKGIFTELITSSILKLPLHKGEICTVYIKDGNLTLIKPEKNLDLEVKVYSSKEDINDDNEDNNTIRVNLILGKGALLEKKR